MNRKTAHPLTHSSHRLPWKLRRGQYGNIATIPTVVELLVSSSATVVDGPQYVLVTKGNSDPIASLAILTVGTPMTPEVTTALSLGLIGGNNASATTLVTTQCPPGFGAVAEATVEGPSLLRCVVCLAGTFAYEGSWEPCEACPVGTTTAPDTGGALGCDWCAPGYGWEGDACVPCAAGTFAANATYSRPCGACEDGLTTSGDGAVVCAAVVATGGTPWWVWVVIGVAFVVFVACVAALAWRYSRRQVISHYYIGTQWAKKGVGVAGVAPD